jgi:hypothetical protein
MSGRDEVLGRALAGLEVPEHRPGFFEELELRLAPPAPRRRLRPLRLALPVAAAAALALAVVLVTGREQRADAAEIARGSRAALATLQSISGRATYRALDVRTGRIETARFSFARTAAGDVRLTRLGPSHGDLAYDAARGIVTSSETSASMGTGRFYAERRGVAPGPPDEPPVFAVLGRELGAAVDTLVAAGDADVFETTFAGRPAWRLELDLRPNTSFADVDHVSVVVDRATELPVRVVGTLGGELRSDLRLELDAVDADLPRALFRLAFPPGAEVQRIDSGFRRVRLADVERAPVPRELPDGFELREVADSGSVVSLSYRRGLQQVVVTARPETNGDPFAVAGVEEPERRVTLPSGAVAHVVVGPRSVPHLWTVLDGRTVTVAGDLDADELVTAAASLRVRAP